MKSLISVSLLILSICTTINAQSLNENWDAYIATYEDGKTGITTLRMDLINQSPIEKLNHVLVTGLTYKTLREDGFAEGKTLDTLYKVADELAGLIEGETNSIQVGSFMYDNERLEYFYVENPENLKAKIESFYKSNYPDYEFYINIKEDQNWEYYREFLYPSKEILNYKADLSVVASLQEAGDNLTKERRVNHWLYFQDENERKNCENELRKLNFNTYSKSLNIESSLPFELKVWRVDFVDIDSIHSITSELRRLARKHNGEYDGWETSVERD